MRAVAVAGPLALCLALGACVETPGVVLPPLADDTCGMAAAAGLIGQDQSAMGSIRRSGPWRVIHPNQPVTMDFSAERLNVYIDQAGRIGRLSCG